MTAIFPATTATPDGKCMAAPNVCKTPSPAGPPIPVPYPNMAMLSDAKGSTCSEKVKFVNKPVVTEASEIGRSSADEAGTAGGVISSKNMGEAKLKKGSAKVIVEGNAAGYQTTVVGQNGTNANTPPGIQTTPSQNKVIISP